MEIARLGIVGAGTMGSGIAANAVAHGIEVRLFDIDDAAIERAGRFVRGFLARQAEKGRMSGGEAEAAAARLRAVRRLEDLAAVDLVIEAVFEDFALKAELFERLSPLLGEETLIATNTSCLRVTDLQRHVRVPGRFLGLHYFSPAQVNPVVEVVSGAHTDERALERALGFLARTGKLALRCRDARGFAINRFFCPYTNEAARALDEGLGSTGEIDAVAREVFGAAAGPFFVMNIIKPRINLHAIRNLEPLGPFYAPAAAMIEHGEADHPFAIDEPGEIPPARRAAIADRLRLGCFLPVLEALDEEVAEPEVFDLGAREALKFRNPPCALMDDLGREEVARILRPALERYGIAPPRALARVGRLAAGS